MVFLNPCDYFSSFLCFFWQLIFFVRLSAICIAWRDRAAALFPGRVREDWTVALEVEMLLIPWGHHGHLTIVLWLHPKACTHCPCWRRNAPALCKCMYMPTMDVGRCQSICPEALLVTLDLLYPAANSLWLWSAVGATPMCILINNFAISCYTMCFPGFKNSSVFFLPSKCVS